MLPFLVAALLSPLAPTAMAQSMDHAQHGSPGTPATPAPTATPGPAKAQPAHDNCTPEHAAMGHCTPKEEQPRRPAPSAPARPADPDCPEEHARMGHCTPKATLPAPAMGSGGTALPAGNAPPPPAPKADYADRVWGADAMAPVRSRVMKEHGGMSFSQVMVDTAEVQVRDGRGGFAWGGEAWFGGDINRFTVKSEGEGRFGDRLETAEVQALYSRAIGPYFNFQGGIRQDLGTRSSRTFATLGFEGLAPYWFHVSGALFLSDRGDLLGRVEGYYDQRITQRLILQPRLEFNLSASSMAADGIGTGLVDAEAGLRLRYEIAREFAPYVGVTWERTFGETARFARQAGEETGGFRFVVGVRAWF
jgi:copper resistance protein B